MARRVVSPYSTRVVLPYDLIMAQENLGPFLVCMTEQQIETIRYVLQYAYRDINWMVDQTPLPGGYGIPLDDEMALINDMLSDLEGNLMSPICTSDLVEAVESLAGYLADMQTCLCSLDSTAQRQLEQLPDLSGYVAEDLVTYAPPENSLAEPTTPGDDDEKCELAQAIYLYLWETETEKLLPFANSTIDSIVNVIIGTLTFAAIATWVGAPFALVSGLFAAFVAWVADGSIANFTNWLFAIKDELVCVIYAELPDYAAAAAAARDFIDAETEPSVLDKALLKALCTEWHFTYVATDQQENGTYDDGLIEDYCDDCLSTPEGCEPTYPCDLDDWPDGTFVCNGSLPQVQGGDSHYTRIAILCPSAASTLTVGWIPRADSGGYAKIQIGVKIQSNDNEHTATIPAAKPVDVLTEDTYSLPGPCQGENLYLWVKQDSWYGDIVYFCITED